LYNLAIGYTRETGTDDCSEQFQQKYLFTSLLVRDVSRNLSRGVLGFFLKNPSKRERDEYALAP